MILYITFHTLLMLINLPVLLFGLASLLFGLDGLYLHKYYHWSLMRLYASFFVIDIVNKAHYEAVFNKERCVYVMNHQTYDALLPALSSRKVAGCVRSWSISIPIIGQLWYLLNFVFVKKGTNTVERAITKLKTDSMLSLGIFPEGTRNSECTFRPDVVKNGAFIISKKMNLPLIPFYHTIGQCINDSTWSINTQRPIRIWIGHPIYPEAKTVDELKTEFISQMIALEIQARGTEFLARSPLDMR
jgi:1-acyl-sn-glycerol-3-phosphate acyltransferase